MYVGKTSFVNLAEPLYQKVINTIDKSQVVFDLTDINESHIPSAILLKNLTERVDNIQNISVTITGVVDSLDQLPTASTNTGKLYIVNGEVYYSNGTSWDNLGTLKGDKGIQGENGLSAYDIAISKGFVGTEEEWLLTIKGENGERGADGKSAYDVAVEQGFVGTITEYLASLKGDRGIQGVQGEKGVQGERGEQGVQGARGIQGIQGIKGDKGDKGEQGIPGKDAPIISVRSGLFSSINATITSFYARWKIYGDVKTVTALLHFNNYSYSIGTEYPIVNWNTANRPVDGEVVDTVVGKNGGRFTLKIANDGKMTIAPLQSGNNNEEVWFTITYI